MSKSESVCAELSKRLTEDDLRKLLAKARRVNAELKKHRGDIDKLPDDERDLGAFLLEHGLFGVLKNLLPSAGQFYRTSGGELLFFREKDHQPYSIEEKRFERYLTWLTGSPSGVKNQWLPQLAAGVQEEAPEVTTHFLAYNDSADLNVIAVNTFDGYMMRREREGQWEETP